MKLFISADIEGTSGIAHWNETERTIPHDYDYFAGQMTREVTAACEGFCRPYDGRGTGGLSGSSGSRCR